MSQSYIVTGFNLDVNFSTVATIPNKNSFFGFSVGLYAGEEESWLLVGAPKSQKVGEIYKCKYEKDFTTSNCTAIVIDRDEPGAPNVTAMFGLTMLPGPTEKELLACAPRFTERTTKTTQLLGVVVYYDMVGVCYFVDDFTNTKSSVYKINPCASLKGNYHDGHDYGQCEIGFSAAFSKDGDTLVLGAPRSFYQGSLMKINLPITRDITKLPVHTGEVKPTIPEGWVEGMYLMQSYDENYLGYASATAKTIESRELLLVGAPARFRYDLFGMVIVFDSDLVADLHKFTGTQTGEYFGSTIATTDLNNDGLDDIIIGAPLYSAKERKIYESGRIFVYYQLSASVDKDGYLDKVTFSEPTIIEGEKAKARFGHVISAIGDINQDGYQDIAVGAPYSANQEGSEHTDGSVFIFNGGPEGLVIPASQEIKGIDLGEDVSAFGSSIYGGKDMDKNLYPDIIAGAYLSSQAFMIRSRPIVKIESTVTTEPGMIDLEKPSCNAKEGSGATICFKITTCFAYNGKSVPESLELSYTYDIDSGKKGDDKRAFIFDEAPRNITLVRKTVKKSKTECVEEYAFLEVNIKDKLSEIQIKVSHSLIEKYGPVQPVLDELQPSSSVASVKIYRDCGDDDICQADLRLESVLSTTQVYAGRSWPFVLEQRIQNKGEPAYQAMLVVEYPNYINYVGTQKEGSTTVVPQLCTYDDKFVTCEVGNPMKHDTDVKVNLKFQTLELNGNFRQLAIKSFVNSTNPVNNTSEVKSSALQIGVKSEITIDNTSSPEGFYTEKEKVSQLVKNTTTIFHTYQVINKGPSDVSKATIQLRWPLKTNDGKVLLEMKELVENHKFVTCSREKLLTNAHVKNATGDGNHYYCDGRAQCAAVDCTVDGIFEQLQIRAVFRLPFATVFQNDYDSYIRSEFDFTIDEYPYPISNGGGPTFETGVTTEFLYLRKPVTTEVTWWIIAIAVAAGILCLLILIFAMWKCGFFKRKRPESADDQMQKQPLNEKVDEDEMEQYLK